MNKLILAVAVMTLMVVNLVAQDNQSDDLYAKSMPRNSNEDVSLSEDTSTDNSEYLDNDLAVPVEASIDMEKNKSFGFEYFPLKRDVLYSYDSNAGDTEAEVSEDDDELVLTYNAGSITYEQQFFKGNDGIYLTRTETSALLFFGSKVTYPEPVLRLPLPLEVGKSWEWEGLETAGSDTGKLTIKGKAIGEEVVKTPLGEFKCLKILLDIESEMGSKNIVTEWLAPEIGVVKFHAELEGSGITGFLQDLMGLDEITFELTGLEEKDNT